MIHIMGCHKGLDVGEFHIEANPTARGQGQWSHSLGMNLFVDGFATLERDDS